MTLFDILVGMATIGSFVVAFIAYRASGTPRQSRHEHVQEQRSPRRSPDTAASPGRNTLGSPEVMIPEGITFGSKVVIVPGL